MIKKMLFELTREEAELFFDDINISLQKTLKEDNDKKMNEIWDVRKRFIMEFEDTFKDG